MFYRARKTPVILLLIGSPLAAEFHRSLDSCLDLHVAADTAPQTRTAVANPSLALTPPARTTFPIEIVSDSCPPLPCAAGRGEKRCGRC